MRSLSLSLDHDPKSRLFSIPYFVPFLLHAIFLFFSREIIGSVYSVTLSLFFVLVFLLLFQTNCLERISQKNIWRIDKTIGEFLKIIWLSENSRTHQASFYLLLSLHRSLLHLCKLWLSWNWLTIAKQEHGLQHYSFRGSWGMKTWLICRDRMQLWKCLCVRHCVYTAMWSFFLVFR